MRHLFVFLFFILFKVSGFSQLNFKVAYQYTYSEPKVHTQIIDQFNDNNSLLQEFSPMENLNTMHGVVLGARYRWEVVGLFVDYIPLYRLREFKGVDGMTGSQLFRKHFYRFDTYSVGLEFFIKNISFGGTYDYNFFRVRTEQHDRRDRYIMYKDNAWGSHFFLGINVYGNEKLSIGLQPYVRIPWTNFDLQDFDNELGADSNLPDYEEEFMTFGFRVIFQNGSTE